VSGRAERYDVVVVGARVAGAATAMLLARAGLRVLVLDRGRPGADTVSTHALMRAGVLQLHRWGLLPRLQAAGTPPVRRTVFHYESGEDVRITLKPSAGVDALYAPRRTLLDALLVDAAARAGAEVSFGATVTGLLHEAGGVAGVRVEMPGRAATPVLIRTPLTVGADGLRSVVATAAGARTTRNGTSSGAILYRYVPDLEADGYEWFYGRRTAAGFIPTNNNELCVFAACAADRLRGMSGTADRRFSDLLRTASPTAAERVADAGSASRLRGFGGAPAHLRQAWGPGWALVGDAGWFKDPLSTHGMTDALRDAELLARAVAHTSPGRQRAAALAAYERLRDQLSLPLLEATERLAGYAWDETEVRGDLRRLSSAMTDEVEALVALDALDVSTPGRAPSIVA
jgi:flavin-dependent dehydrogenase